MPANNRDIDSNTRAYMTRFGVDWKNEAFREEYWSYRDFWAQVQSYVMSQQYDSLLKKANFKSN